MSGAVCSCNKQGCLFLQWVGHFSVMSRAVCSCNEQGCLFLQWAMLLGPTMNNAAWSYNEQRCLVLQWTMLLGPSMSNVAWSCDALDSVLFMLILSYLCLLRFRSSFGLRMSVTPSSNIHPPTTTPYPWGFEKWKSKSRPSLMSLSSSSLSSSTRIPAL